MDETNKLSFSDNNILKFNKNINKIDFSFKSVNHYVQAKVSEIDPLTGKKKTSSKSKQILTNISGQVKAGEILAILGPSGAGKTTLLDILSHRLNINGTGVIYLNESESDFNTYKKVSGYVTQSDTLTPSMTVNETLSFYAQLKMPRSVPLADKFKKVEEVIAEMGLKRCRDTLVGTADNKIRGISGGERRRLTIAIELLTSPSILCLDEPTSGLDSSTSYAVMNAIRKLANSGRTIICTIHQPRYNIFNMFDKLLLLAEGHSIYQGRTDKSTEYFERLGYICPLNANPADYFLDLINTQVQDDPDVIDNNEMQILNTMESGGANSGHSKVRKLTTEELDRFKREYQQSPEAQHLNECLEEIIRNTNKKPLEISKRDPPTYFTQFKLLFYRETLNARRHPMALRVQVIQSLFQGLLCGLVYFQLGLGQNTIQSRTGVLAFIIMGISFPNTMSTINVFPEVVGIFLKDRAAGVYNTLPFFLAKSLMDIMLGIVLPVISGTMVFWMTNQRIYPFYSAEVFFKFILVLVMAAQCSLSLGVLISSSVPTVQVGLAVAPLIVILFFLFSGFFVNLNELPRGWVWFPYISFFKYIIEAAVINAYTNVRFSCNESQVIGGRCPIETGEQVIKNLGYNIDNYWRDIVILLAYIVGFRILTYCVLRLKSRSKFVMASKSKKE